MINRCNNPKNRSYDRYGGRGIEVCEEWMSFERFLSDMGKKPSAKHSIERRNVDGPYSAENCQWADDFQQANNTRRNHIITFKEESFTISQWARKMGISEDSLERRINKLGWPIEKAITTPARGWGPGKPKIMLG